MTEFIDLHCHSTYSLKDGIGHPKEIVARAKELGWTAAAITEHGWMGSAFPFYKACVENGIKPIIGCELYVVSDDLLGVNNKETRKASFHLTALALSIEGYQNLVAWNNVSMRRENFYYKPRISLEAMVEHAPHPLHHNVVLSGCLGGELCQMLLEASYGIGWKDQENLGGRGRKDQPGIEQAVRVGLSYVRAARSLFSNFFIEVQNHHIGKFIGRGYSAYESLLEHESVVRRGLLEIASATNTPVVVTNDSHLQTVGQRKAHVAMKASAWRQRDDEHYSHSQEQIISKYLPEYVYFGNYMRDMEAVADGLPSGALESISEIVAEANLRLDPLDNFGYCVEPNTRVLTRTLNWKKACDLVVGEKLLAFDEDLNGVHGDSASLRARRWRESQVQEKISRVLPCYRIVFESGAELISSDTHRWLVCVRDGKTATQVMWRTSNTINPGDRIPRYLNVWSKNRTWESGWVAGIFDGEGSVTAKRRVTANQVPGRIFNKMLRAVRNLGFQGSEYSYEGNSTDSIHIAGGISETLRFLGTVRPSRLLRTVVDRLAGSRLERIGIETVAFCEFLGNREVVALQTTTKTFFADGFGSHNSIPRSGYDDTERAMRRIAASRLKAAITRHGKAARKRFEHELESMGEFAHYLLLMSDFIRGAKERGILTNTRGSAANSFLCYCLEIHDVDSIEYGLVFTRFFNPARKKFPDIDIDVEKDRHEDFMQLVQEHMAALEGEGQVVPMCNLGTAANRKAFRMAAGALGMPKEEQDEISKLLPQMIDSGMVDEEQDAYEVLKEEYPQLYELASTMFDTLNNVGQHACAYLFGTKDRPIEQWVPLYLISSSGSLVTQYDMNALDDFGLVKGDFLRLRTLSVVKRTLSLLGQSPLDLEKIPLDDSATFEMLREGRTEGIFTLQGKENRKGCIEVGVETVHDVIASVALYRPALTRTGMHTKFNDRRFGREEIEYPHSLAEEILSSTNGIPVFQEQVMELGYAVGMNDAEVDEIYQAIKKAKGVGRHAKAAFEAIEPKFFKRAKKVMDRADAEAYWKLIMASQGYGFNKGHATSYGILAVRSAYLKANHPSEFFTALLDVYPEKHKYIAAARSEGFKFLPPSVNDSSAGFSFDRDTGGIRVGLARIKGLGPVAIREILAGQPYTSFDDFKERTTRRAVNATRIETLAGLGAFDCVGISAIPSDSLQLAALGFTLRKPRILKGVKVKHTKERGGDGKWHHRGREKGAEATEYMSSVSKLFWIPENATLDLKASPWAQVKTWLLQAVDENGIQFHIMVNEDKEWNVKILKFLYRHCQGKAIAIDGAVRSPFLQDGPMGYRFYSVTGGYKGEAQVFGVNEKILKTISKATQSGRVMRYAA